MATDLLEAPRATLAAPSARPPARRRKLGAHPPGDRLALVGSLASSFALVALCYWHLLDTSGTLGFLISWYVGFLLVYGSVLSMSSPRPVVTERLVAAALSAAAGVVAFAFLSTVIYTFAEGWRALVHSNFFTHDMSAVSPTAPLSQGGILHAIVGTVIEIAIAIAISLPLGIGTAVYLSEVGGRLSGVVRAVVNAMTALPEILAGLFIYVTLIVDLGLPKSGLAVSVAMAVTMVPIIARAAEVALRVVPGELREASKALGAKHWKTTWSVVLPAARPGLAGATILAIARGIGETAVVLIVSGASSFLTFNPTGNPMNSLPLFIYSGYVSHEPTAISRAFGAASVLLLMVLALFVITRVVARERVAGR